jgi:hypothetical protein
MRFRIKDIHSIVFAMGENDLAVVQDFVCGSAILICAVASRVLFRKDFSDFLFCRSHDRVLAILAAFEVVTSIGGSKLGLVRNQT